MAVLLAIRELHERDTEGSQKPPKKKKPNLRALLLAPSKEALAEELLALTARDRTLRQALLLRFRQQAVEIEGSRRRVRPCLPVRSLGA